MPERRRTFLKTVGGTAVALTLAGCGQSEDGTDDDGTDGNTSDDGMEDGNMSDDDGSEGEAEPASLGVAHLSPDAPNVDVYVDGDAVLEDVPYRAFSDYLDLTAGEYDIEITAAGDADTVVFDQTVELGAGDFTAAAVGELAEQNQPFGVEIFEHDLEPPADAARVRAIHASPDAPNVDITVAETGDVLFADVPFGAAGSAEVPEGAYTLEIRPATPNNDGDVVATFDVELAAQTVYSVAAVGYLDPDTAPADEAFGLEVAVDAGEDDFEPAEDAGLNVAHLSPDAPNVDVYVDGDAVLEDVPYRTFSNYLELAPGEYDIEITAAGDADTVVFDQTVEVGAGDFTAAALGELAEQNQPFSVEIFETNRELPEEGARVRAIHASPDAPNVDITVEETGDVLFADVPFGAAGTVEVPGGSYTLEIRPATENNDGDVVATFPVELAAETVYTAAAVGYLQPDSAPADEAFDLALTVDAE